MVEPFMEYREVSVTDPLRQGDVLEAVDADASQWKRHLLVITADCDFVHGKHQGRVTCVPLLLAEEFLLELQVPRLREKYISTKLLPALRRILSAVSGHQVSDDRLRAWPHELAVTKIIGSLGLTGEDADVANAAFEAIRLLGEPCSTLDDAVSNLIDAQLAGPRPQTRDNIVRGVSESLKGPYSQPPGDALFLSAIGPRHDVGYFAYLRHLEQVLQPEIAIGPTRTAVEYRRISRLQDRYTHAIVQRFLWSLCPSASRRSTRISETCIPTYWEEIHVKPLIMTVRAAKELATGLSPDAVSASPHLVKHAGTVSDVLLTSADHAGEQRMILIRDENKKELYVPEHLAERRRDVLSRMASFAERARTTGPLSLPRGWHQYKHHNLIAFFALSSGDSAASRWIVELLPGEQTDAVFWRTTTSDRLEALEAFESAKPRLPEGWEGDWDAAVAAASERAAQVRSGEASDVEISLSPLDPSATKGWSYIHWLDSISDDQRSFIEAVPTKSIRLRGPAGSGKTLALTLKAIREVLAAREAGVELRVLVVTHSWSMATEIADSLDSMAVGPLGEIDVFPLLEVAQTISPHYVRDDSGFSLIGTDSFSGKQAQLDEILDVLEDFISGDWVTYRAGVSEKLRVRLDSDNIDERYALAWDLLVEFGSVIGAAAIFPGAGAEARYLQLPRAAWMLPFDARNDMRVVFAIYSRYMASLDERALLTSDQVLADLLSHLETHAWNRARRTEGYDLIFVDEFHLFSPLERQVLHYLSREVATYPRVFMAVDPRQSPSESFIGVASDETQSLVGGQYENLGDVSNFELTSVHRFTPEILSLIKHVHHEFPTLDLGHDWDVDFSAVESVKENGPVPQLILSASREGEETDIAKAVQELYPQGRLALAVVDTRQWRRFSALAFRIGQARKFHVSTISGRTDVEGLGYRSRGLVVGPAEYLAGLQFEVVLVAGLPDLRSNSTPANERTRLLSLLYLGLSRAQAEIRVFVNEDDGGVPEVLGRAITNGVLEQVRGSLV